MKRVTYRITKLLLSSTVLIWFAWYLYENRELLSHSLTASAREMTILAGLILCTWIFNSLQVLLFLRLSGGVIGFWENLLLQSATLLGNYMPMRLGTIARFRYLKLVHGIEYTRLGGIAGLRVLLLTSTAGGLGCLGLAGLARDHSHAIHPLLWLSFLAMLIAPLALWLIASRLQVSGVTQSAMLAELFISSFVDLRFDLGVGLKIILLLLAQFLMLALRLQVSFAMVGLDVSTWFLFLLAPTGTLLSFLNLTPGNLGLREWLFAALSLATGYPFAEAMVAGILDRAVLMVCVFVFGSLSFPFLMSRLRGASVIPVTLKAGDK